jgi:nitroimidazol reductase NimA-like FMN-containing flavoprotein (pyridoxamine 5'-phosphate oxidase superfamily)
MPSMTKSAREEFLAGQHVGVISIARAEGPPLTVPVWYRYEPGGDVVVQTGPGSLKYRLLDRAREFSLLAQTETPPYKYVSVQGPIVRVEDETSKTDLAAMAHRYFDEASATEFLASIEGETIAQLHMRPERWYTSDQTPA